VNGTNVARKGFLRNQNIITASSPEINCDSDFRRELVIDNKIIISKYKNKVTTSQYSSSQIKLNTRNNHLKNIYSHHGYLTNGTDALANIDLILAIQNENLASNNEIENDIYNSSSNTKLETEEEFEGYFHTAIIMFKVYIKEIALFAFFTLTFIAIVLVFLYLLSIICRPFRDFLKLQNERIQLKYENVRLYLENLKQEHLNFV
jgi:hypothetical protein